MCLYTDEQLHNAVKISYSISETRRRLGLSTSGSGSSAIKTRIQKLGIDTSHFDSSKLLKSRLSAIGKLQRRPLEEIICEDSSACQQVLRKAVKREQLLPYICFICSNPGKHFGRVLCLQLDHINGIRNDNRLENLRWLCPNCHSQTATWGNKTINRSKQPAKATSKKVTSKIAWPPLNEILKKLESSSYVQVAQELGISDTAIRKHLSRRQIDPKTLKFRGTLDEA